MSFIWKWYKNVLEYFGFATKSGKLLFVGLDNAGKTTLMMRLVSDKLAQPCPTHHPTCEEFQIRSTRFTLFDLGGHQTARFLWKQFYPAADGIVFIVDAADRSRLDEARNELFEILADEAIAAVPIMILGNKIDRPNVLSEDALKNQLGVTQLCTGKDINYQDGRRPLEVFMCSIRKRYGYGQGFQWISDFFK